jgi:hypothetical protein
VTYSPETGPTIIRVLPEKQPKRKHTQEQVQRRADRRHPERTGGRAATAELCRRHVISEQTFDTWKKKYGGLDVGDAKRLKQLEEETVD